jgi:hypothetical protein
MEDDMKKVFVVIMTLVFLMGGWGCLYAAGTPSGKCEGDANKECVYFDLGTLTSIDNTTGVYSKSYKWVDTGYAYISNTGDNIITYVIQSTHDDNCTVGWTDISDTLIFNINTPFAHSAIDINDRAGICWRVRGIANIDSSNGLSVDLYMWRR